MICYAMLCLEAARPSRLVLLVLVVLVLGQGFWGFLGQLGQVGRVSRRPGGNALEKFGDAGLDSCAALRGNKNLGKY